MIFCSNPICSHNNNENKHAHNLLLFWCTVCRFIDCRLITGVFGCSLVWVTLWSRPVRLKKPATCSRRREVAGTFVDVATLCRITVSSSATALRRSPGLRPAINSLLPCQTFAKSRNGRRPCVDDNTPAPRRCRSVVAAMCVSYVITIT